MTPSELTGLLRRSRFSFGTEAALQLSLAGVLEEAGIPFEREVRLSIVDRIDFMVDGRIGIEAKVRYPKRAIYRQLQRYAASSQIEALVLITATALGLPPALEGKPLFYVSVGRTAL